MSPRDKPLVGRLLLGGSARRVGGTAPGHRRVEGKAPAHRGEWSVPDGARHLSLQPLLGVSLRLRPCRAGVASPDTRLHLRASWACRDDRSAPQGRCHPPGALDRGQFQPPLGRQEQGVTGCPQVKLTQAEAGSVLSPVPCSRVLFTCHPVQCPQGVFGALVLWHRRLHCLARLDCPSTSGWSTDRTLSGMSSPHLLGPR